MLFDLEVRACDFVNSCSHIYAVCGSLANMGSYCTSTHRALFAYLQLLFCQAWHLRETLQMKGASVRW